MRDHDEIRSMLAALAGGDLSVTDRMLVKQHLVDCKSCRAELVQLQLVLQAVKSTPDVEPPPWLATRIMAQVREEGVQQRGWLARLFLPIKIKLPLEAFALVMICVTAWYVMQEVDRSQQVQSDVPTIKAPVSESVKDSTLQPAPKPPPAAPVASKVHTPPSVQSAAPVVQESSALTSAPAPRAAMDRAERMERAKSASEAASASPTSSPEQSAGSPAPMAERKMATKRKSEHSDNRLDATSPQLLQIRLVVNDREAFPIKLADILQRLGGSMLSSRPGNAFVRIDASSLPELQVQLARLGRIAENTIDQIPREGLLKLQVYW